MKKILVLCGSGRRNGNSEKLADSFIAGAMPNNEITKVTLADKKISPCRHCNYCQTHHGECAIQDDMRAIFAALQNNDILVFSSPVYYLDFTAQLKTVIDRTYAESAVGRKIKQSILLSVAGKKEDFVSDCIINSYQRLCDYLGFQSLGIIAAKGFENMSAIDDAPVLRTAFELGQSII